VPCSGLGLHEHGIGLPQTLHDHVAPPRHIGPLTLSAARTTIGVRRAYTGTYTVDEGTRTIHVNIGTCTFPNLVGAPNHRRIVTSITADEMKFTNPCTSAGLTLEIVWKRAK